MLLKCDNPECEKQVPSGTKYCSKACLVRHKEIDPELKRRYEKFDNPLKQLGVSNSNIWLGQTRRKLAFKIIEDLIKKLSPINYKKLICMIAYKTGLSTRKIGDDYLEVLKETGILKMESNIILGIDKKRMELLSND